MSVPDRGSRDTPTPMPPVFPTRGGHLLTPGGYRATGDLTGWERFENIAGLLGTLWLIHWCSTHPRFDHPLTIVAVAVLGLVLTQGETLLRFFLAGRDVRAHGYPNLQAYRAAAYRAG